VSFTYLENGRYPLPIHLIDLYQGLDETISSFFNCIGPVSTICTSPFPKPDPPKFWTETTDPFSFFPNPAHQEVRVNFLNATSITAFEIYDPLCRIVYSTSQVYRNNYINVSDWPSGIYYGLARSGHEIHVKTLIVTGQN
jgi:hypothetical protein